MRHVNAQTGSQDRCGIMDVLWKRALIEIDGPAKSFRTSMDEVDSSDDQYFNAPRSTLNQSYLGENGLVRSTGKCSCVFSAHRFGQTSSHLSWLAHVELRQIRQTGLQAKKYSSKVKGNPQISFSMDRVLDCWCSTLNLPSLLPGPRMLLPLMLARL